MQTRNSNRLSKLLCCLLIVSCLIIGLLGDSDAVHAEGCDQRDANRVLIKSIPLIVKISISPSQGDQAVAFEYIQYRFQLEANGQVILSSTSDGTGRLSTDDHVMVRSDHGRTWEWDFRNESRTQIVPIPPQDITDLFESGENTFEITLTDLMGPEYSSWAYYLVIYACPSQETPTATPTVTPSPTPTPTVTATKKPTLTPTMPPTATPVPTDTATPSATPTATATHTPMAKPRPTYTPAVVAAPVELTPLPPEPQQRSLPIWPFAASALAVVTGSGLWILTKTGKRLAGEIEVHRKGRFVHKVPLYALKKRRPTIGSQGDILLPSTEMPETVAQIYADKGMDGQIEMYLDLLDGSDGTVIESILLYHGIEINLPDGYSVKYINPVTQEWFNEGEHYA